MQGLTCRPVLKGQQFTNAAVGMWKLLGGTLDGAVVDAIDDVMGRHAVNGAADRLGRTQHLLHHTCSGKTESIMEKEAELDTRQLYSFATTTTRRIRASGTRQYLKHF